MKHLKLSLALISSIFAISAVADNTDYSGVYFDLQAGWISPHFNIQPNEGIANFAADPLTAILSIAPKLSLGYQFNQNFALQVGYLLADYNTTSGGLEPNFKSTLTYYDIAGKAIYPVTQNFNVNALLGLAYGVQTVSGSTISAPNGTDTALEPEIGAGMAYNITPNFSVSLSTLVIAGSNNIEPTFYIPLGISYRF